MMVYPLSPSDEDLSDLQARLGVRFRDEALLLQALTHPSWVEEDALGGHTPRHPSQEPLVEIGGAALAEVVTQCLRRDHPKAVEHGLCRVATSYTRGGWPDWCGRRIGLDTLLRVGSGAQTSRSYDVEPIERTLKAVLGALSADGQDDAVERLIAGWFMACRPSSDKIRILTPCSNVVGAVSERLCWWHREGGLKVDLERDGPLHRSTWRLTYDLTAIGLGVYVGEGSKIQHAKSSAFDDIFRDAVLYGLIR